MYFLTYRTIFGSQMGIWANTSCSLLASGFFSLNWTCAFPACFKLGFRLDVKLNITQSYFGSPSTKHILAAVGYQTV